MNIEKENEGVLNHPEQLEYILSISRQMSEMRSLEPLLAFIIDEALKIVGAERGYIVLKKEGDDIDFRVLRDRDAHDLEPQSDIISRSILQKTLQSGQPLVVRNAMADPRFSQALSVVALRLRSVMCVPLTTQNSTIGAIYVENRTVHGRFKEEDIIPLELMAHQAAVAVQNAKLNDDLEVANENLRHLDEMKNKFIMLISHELRTPLTAVKSYGSVARMMLESESFNDRAAEAGAIGDKLSQSIDRLTGTVTEIIQIFRIISGQLYLEKHLIDLNALIGEIMHDFQDMIDKRGLIIERVDIESLPSITGDTNLLREMFNNIIGNAIKFTPDHGKIMISGRSQNGQVEIKIQDSGIGIPRTEHKRVFDLFHVLGSILNHSTSKSSFLGGGMGLGLPTAKGIIEAHLGKIYLISPVQKDENYPGTACVITLPTTLPATGKLTFDGHL